MLPGIGVFGTGDLVSTLVHFLRSKGFHVEAIWGRTLEIAENNAKELDVKFYTNKIDDVLLRKDVDLVFIMCQPNLHAQIAVKALGIGKHVLCDTPAGLCQLEVLKMVQAAQYYPSLISVVAHGLRFLPAVTQMRRHVSAGFVGSVYVLEARVSCGAAVGSLWDWRCSRLMGGGVLAGLGGHIIDAAAFVLGERATRAHGMTRTFRARTERINGIRWIDADDFCTFQLSLPSGVAVNASVNSHASSDFEQEITVCGSEGRLRLRGASLFGCRYDKGQQEQVLHEDDTTPAGTAKQLSPSLPAAHTAGFLRLVSALASAFEAGASEVPSAATFEDGQYVQAVVDAVQASAKSRHWEQIIVESIY